MYFIQLRHFEKKESDSNIFNW